jgi:DNA-binding transcriptional LysR family regulator
MEMYQIRYFLAVSETLNLTRAAERCNVAQPSLTRAIRALESELGGELLRRERALSHLTALGQRMLPMLRQCYETALTAKTIAASMRKGEAASVSIAISQTVGLRYFTHFLQELSRAFPGLRLQLHRGSSKEVVECLKAGTAELAIAGPLGETWSRLDTFPLFDEPFDLVVSTTHKLAGKHSAEFKELTSDTFMMNGRCEIAGEIKDCLAANGVLATATHQVTTQEDLLALVKADLGVAIVPVGAVEGGGLCRISLDELNLTRRVSLYTVSGRSRATACATLLNLLRASDWDFDMAAEHQSRVQ